MLITPWLRFRWRAVARSATALAAAASLLLGGCTTIRNVPPPYVREAPQAAVVKVGDKVRVHTRSGQSVAFVVTAVDPESISGKNIRVPFAEISVLQVERVDALRTTGLVAGIVASLVVIAAIVAVATHGIAFMPSGPS